MGGDRPVWWVHERRPAPHGAEWVVVRAPGDLTVRVLVPGRTARAGDAIALIDAAVVAARARRAAPEALE
jgi:hypothetical protein